MFFGAMFLFLCCTDFSRQCTVSVFFFYTILILLLFSDFTVFIVSDLNDVTFMYTKIFLFFNYTVTVNAYLGNTSRHYGLAFAVATYLEGKLLRYWPVSDRLAVLQLSLGRHSTLTVINAYGPTSQATLHDQDTQDDF